MKKMKKNVMTLGHCGSLRMCRNWIIGSCKDLQVGVRDVRLFSGGGTIDSWPSNLDLDLERPDSDQR